MRRACAGARTWMPLRTVARRLGRNSNLRERVVEKRGQRNTVTRWIAGEGTEVDGGGLHCNGIFICNGHEWEYTSRQYK